MTEHHAIHHPLSNSSHPLSEDEFRKETQMSLIKSSEKKPFFNFEKMSEDKNNNIFNFIEFHLQNEEKIDSYCVEKAETTNFLFHLRPNSCMAIKNTSQEFFRKEMNRNKKKTFEFLKSFIREIANSEILRTYKDYYPKV